MPDEKSTNEDLRRQLEELRQALPPLRREQLELMEAMRRLEADATLLGQADIVTAVQRAGERLRTTGGALARAEEVFAGLAGQPETAPAGT